MVMLNFSAEQIAEDGHYLVVIQLNGLDIARLPVATVLDEEEVLAAAQSWFASCHPHHSLREHYSLPMG